MTINVNCPPRGLFIGRETENVARTLTVDFSAWAAEHGPGTLQVLLQRPGDATPYPVTLTVDGTVATWKPSETDLAEAGTGAVQIIYTVEDVRVKTSIIPVMVEPSLGVETDPPEGWTSWIDQLTDLAAETEQHAANAAESAGNAAEAAAGALQSATDAGSAKNAAVAAAEAAAASVSHYPQIVGGVWYVWSPTAGEYISTGIDAQGEDGVSPTVEITAIQGGHRVVITDAEGSHTFDVLDGVTPDMSAYRTAAEQDVIDDAQDEELNNLKSALDTKAGILKDTASGSVASFVPDSTVPDLLGLDVHLEPIQDLHGYDNPWPAGGGVNKFDANAVTTEDFSISNSTFTNTKTDTRAFFQLSVQQFNNGSYFKTVSTHGFTDTGRKFAKISGIEEGITSLRIKHNGSTRDLLLCDYRWTGTDDLWISFNIVSNNPTVAGGLVISDIQLEIATAGSTQASAYHPYSNICPISGRDSVTVNANGTTYTIQLGETVYGGTLDVTAGTLTVDRAMVDLGTKTWVRSGYDWRFSGGTVNDMKSTSATADGIACSAYNPSIRSWATYGGANICINKRTFILSDERFVNDASGLNAWLQSMATAGTPVTATYPLATPIIIQLDPVQIATIANQTNNVWADAGDVTVEYAADLKTYIDSKIAAAVAAMS